MNIRRITLVLLALLPLVAFGQKKAIKHSDYDGWKRMSNSSITDDGQWVKYIINPQEGDGCLYLYNVKSGKQEKFERGNGAIISADAEFMAYKVKPEFAVTRQAKRDKKKPDEMPKSNLGIKILGGGEPVIIERVKSFKMGADGGEWIAYLMEKPLKEKAKEKAETEEKKEPKTKEKKPKSDGTELIIFNPLSNKKHSFKDVINYGVSKDGSVVGFVQETTDTAKVKHYKVQRFDTAKESSQEIFAGEGSLKKLIVDNKGANMGFIYSSDTSKVKVYSLWLSEGTKAKKIVGTDTDGMKSDWSVSEFGSISFSDSGKRLLFGTALAPVKEPEDTLLKDEKYKLDIWSWHDPYLQPQQKLSLKRDREKSYQAVYFIEEAKMLQLADKDLPSVRLLEKGDGDIAIGSSNLKYRKLTSWESNRYQDYYKINLKTGKRSTMIEAAPSVVNISPSGKHMLVWCIKTRSWLSRPTEGGEFVDLTSKLKVAFHNELHDSPSEPSPYSYSPKWIDGDKYVLVNDRYDIWKIDVSGAEAPVNLTNAYGRQHNTRYSITSLHGFGSPLRKDYVGAKEMLYLTTFNYKTKDAGLATLKVNKAANPSELFSGPYAYGSYVKADDAAKVIFTKGDYANYPELHVGDLKFSKAVKVSETNPQQKDFNWGTNELVEWRSFDGQMLQGILYKPEDFDPNKKYPMIVYFYERSSDGIHRYNAPAPSASTVNRTYAVSNGYLVFVPDIPYVEGYPGHSAYNAIVSGTYSMLDQFDFIDPDRLGLDGQSWGGYQIAYLITQTDMYACAFSGAPVSNMTSAYGGIRWGSGMSRMFQYEKTQSRIGGTLWEKPIQYIENSPVFFVPKIQTPVLIMHNDADGAVPWYQGIEFFVALRRLEKPAWMLSYNDEAHNLRGRANRKDLSVRKMQFFDHYLQGAAAPYWMEKGISQLEKGKIDGYDLVKK